MAVRGRPFPKGVSGNPSGRRPTSPDVKVALQALTREARARLVGIVEAFVKIAEAKPSQQVH